MSGWDQIGVYILQLIRNIDRDAELMYLSRTRAKNMYGSIITVYFKQYNRLTRRLKAGFWPMPDHPGLGHYFFYFFF